LIAEPDTYGGGHDAFIVRQGTYSVAVKRRKGSSVESLVDDPMFRGGSSGNSVDRGTTKVPKVVHGVPARFNPYFIQLRVVRV
jgi:hypothetical protein